MSNVTLIPTGTSIITSFGNTSGIWTADGVNTPVGAQVWLKHSLAGAPNLYWSLLNTTRTTTLIPQQTLTVIQFDALVSQTDAAGYKLVPLQILNPSYGAPIAGDTISFTMAAASKWSMKTGTVTSGEYALAVAVPEPNMAGPAMACMLIVAAVGRWFIRRR